MDLLRAGDRAEFARLVEVYSRPIYRLALRMLADPLDAEDVLQVTFLKAMQAIASFEARSSLSTWLYRIAANEALMLIRRRRPQVGLDEEPDDESVEPPARLADFSALPEDVLLSDEGRRLLDRAVAALPEGQRAVFLLRDVEGLSIRATGEALGLSETNVKTRLLRARLRLREQLSAYYAERLGQEQAR